MRIPWIIALLISTTLASEAPQLDMETFDELMKTKKNGMIKFFQPWCGHCTRMKPDWDLLHQHVNGAFIADINCGEQKELCDREGIGGYPTIKVYKNGKEDDLYQGPRSFELLYQFVQENLVPNCRIHKLHECSEKAAQYVEKWSIKEQAAISKELQRLRSLEHSNMNWDLKAWLKERQGLLQQML